MRNHGKSREIAGRTFADILPKTRGETVGTLCRKINKGNLRRNFGNIFDESSEGISRETPEPVQEKLSF